MWWCHALNFAILLLLLLLLQIATAAQLPLQAFSKEIDISEEKYVVQVGREGKICGGALIEQLWVLTAAHCVVGFEHDEIFIFAGTSTTDGDAGELRSVVMMELAPGAMTTPYTMDIALLQLNAPLVGDNIDPIHLENNIDTSLPLKFVGWGRTTEGGRSSGQLRSLEVPMLWEQICKKFFDYELLITPSMVCSANPGKNNCSGDTGGPVVQNGKLVGIVSRGTGCSNNRTPGLFTRISSVRDWIESIAILY